MVLRRAFNIMRLEIGKTYNILKIFLSNAYSPVKPKVGFKQKSSPFSGKLFIGFLQTSYKQISL